MDFFLPLLGGALGAAFVNGLFTWWKYTAEKKDAVLVWRRDQKTEAYAAFLLEVDNSFAFVLQDADVDPNTFLAPAFRELNRVKMFGPAAAADAGERLLVRLSAFLSAEGDRAGKYNAYHEAYRQYLKLMRKDLGIEN